MTLKMTSPQVVETSVIVNNNSSFQNYTNPDDHTQQTTDTPGFKPFTVQLMLQYSDYDRYNFRLAKQPSKLLLQLLKHEFGPLTFGAF